MSLMGLGRVKTKSDLVVMPSGRQIFAFFCSPHDHRAQNSRCGDTARSFYTVRVISLGGDRGRGLAAAQTDQAKARAEDKKQKAVAKVEELQTQLDAAKANAKSKLDAAAAAQDAAKAAETKKADAAKAASEAKRALEPVSVFISRATQKLYVRRHTHKRLPDGGEVFDETIEVPVTIRNPDKPIGTHVFTAVARTDGGLRWTAVTIDSGDVAKAALDRITVPQDVLDRIAPTALPRSSLIISDEPLHRETN